MGDWALRYYSPAKKCKLDSAWVGPYLVASLAGWAVGIQLQPDSPIIIVHCQYFKKIPRPSGLVSWIDVARPVGVPTLPVLGASTMGHTTQGSPSIAAVPPEEGAVLSEIASAKSAQFPSESRTCRPEGSGMDVSSTALSSAVVSFPQEVLLVDATSILHTFSTNRLDAGPIRLTTIAHAFNYRVAVLRDGVKSTARVGRSRRAVALEVPAFLQNIGKLRGVSHDVQLSCEPWGHADHNGGGCDCLSSDRTGAYVHSLSLIPRESLSGPELEDVSVSTRESGDRRSHILSIGVGRLGSVPFVSHRPGAYGRLLLAVYVQWKMGLLVASDWLRPVTRGSWRTGPPLTVRGGADVN